MIKEIQGLRAIAILMVLFVHSMGVLPPKYHETIFKIQSIFFISTGVELFFVLAGYFLVKSLEKYNAKNTEHRVKNAVDFILYKFKRLSPNIYFWSSLTLAFSIISNNDQIFYTLDVEFKKYISTILFLRNFLETSNMSWFGIYWAVSLELQTFLVVSIFYFLFGRKYLFHVSVVITILMMFYRFGEAHAWLFRFDAILYGVILYGIMQFLDKQRLKMAFRVNKFWKLILCVGLILCLSSTLKTFSEYPNFNISVSSIIATIMVFLALTGNGFFYINIPILSSVVDWLASRSYSIFCCHIFCWFFIKQICIYFGLSESLYTMVISILFMFICSELSYRYIENYFSRKI